MERVKNTQRGGYAFLGGMGIFFTEIGADIELFEGIWGGGNPICQI